MTESIGHDVRTRRCGVGKLLSRYRPRRTRGLDGVAVGAGAFDNEVSEGGHGRV